MSKITVHPVENPEAKLTPEQRKRNALRAAAVASSEDALFAKKLLENPPQTQNTRDYTSIRRVATRAFLVHSAMCSKILFPASGKRNQELANDLRASFGIADDSPLGKRDVRDSFEHIDERLEAWAENTPYDQPNVDWYTNGLDVEIPEAFAKNVFSAYLNGRIITPGRNGEPLEFDSDIIVVELRKIAGDAP